MRFYLTARQTVTTASTTCRSGGLQTNSEGRQKTCAEKFYAPRPRGLALSPCLPGGDGKELYDAGGQCVHGRGATEARRRGGARVRNYYVRPREGDGDGGRGRSLGDVGFGRRRRPLRCCVAVKLLICNA